MCICHLGVGQDPDLILTHCVDDTRSKERKKDIDPLAFPFFWYLPLYQQTLKMVFQAWAVAQLVKRLSSMHKAPGSIPSTT